jgi:hypothetical protein
MLDPLAAAYAAADEDFSDWWPDGAVPVYESKRWVLHADMRLAEARGVEEALEGASVAPVEEESKEAMHASLTVQRIYRALCHIWAKDGSHAGWHDGMEVRQRILQVLEHRVGRATAYRYLKEEKELFSKGDARAVRERFDMAELINATRSEDKERAQLMPEEEPAGRPYQFQPAWYPALVERCNKLQKLLGFGPYVVQAFATLLFARSLQRRRSAGTRRSCQSGRR